MNIGAVERTEWSNTLKCCYNTMCILSSIWNMLQEVSWLAGRHLIATVELLCQTEIIPPSCQNVPWRKSKGTLWLRGRGGNTIPFWQCCIYIPEMFHKPKKGGIYLIRYNLFPLWDFIKEIGGGGVATGSAGL